MLKLLNLGGVSVQQNLFVYETPEEALLIDCGIGFPEAEDYGVDIIIPGFEYILDIQEKVRGLLITHAHEDHYGATPYLLKELPLTVYAHPMVQDFLVSKLDDFSDYNKPKFKDVEAEKSIQVGKDFNLFPYRVNHSVPNTLGFFIKTPFGTVVHQSDFKFDWTPIMDEPADVKKIASLAEKLDPVLLLSDSLGSTHSGFTRSERFIEDSFDLVVKEAKGQVFITTMSSNISRIQQAINSAVSHNRKVVISGYSIENNLEVALKHDLIKAPDGTLISEREMKKYDDSELLFIVPGNYGQVGSTLDKISKGRHREIKLHEDATVVFSGDPIPGTEPAVDKVIDNLILKGAHVVYSELQEDLHVSGHGSRGDLTLMAHLIGPKYYAPIGGGIKHMRAYRDMLADQGVDINNVFELKDGESLEISGKEIKTGKTIDIEETFIDNNHSKASIEGIVLKDRKMLADSGVIFVVVPYKDNKPVPNKSEIYTRGYIYVKENRSLLNGMKKNVASTISSLQGNDQGFDFSTLKKAVEKSLKKHLYKRVGESPVIIVERLEL